MPREEIHQGVVRRAFHRPGGYADFQGVAVQTGDLAAGSAGLDVQFDLDAVRDRAQPVAHRTRP